ncbi:MAG TPA: hypothetical protein VNG51_27040 [Ktedonobacteraceae bacterium]|nr:hypothetical protein [Ktedonobacteraceae bacterium]
MVEQTTFTQVNEPQTQQWSQQLQRRIIRLLLQHNEPLFRNSFGRFFVQSKLPQIPLLRQYDRFIRLRSLSSELLDDIMPRIRRQLSLKTNQQRLQEETPTRGDIDWQRTFERNWTQSPGQLPLQFDTRLRQRSMETPENLLTVAILLAFRRELQQVMQEHFFADEDLSTQERQIFAALNEQAERELAAPYARLLTETAQRVDIATFSQSVALRLRPGPNPYRILLGWWQRFTTFRAGRASENPAQALASKRDNEKMDAWLYELWIVLEFLHLLTQNNAVQPQDMTVATDLLQFTFTWQHRRFRFIYNRQLDTATGYETSWQHQPASRPDYTIEREHSLRVPTDGALIWREPPVVLDAKYYLEGSDPTSTHSPIKKLLGDMALLGVQEGALFFPQIAEPENDQHVTRTLQRTDQRYHVRGQEPQHIHLYHLSPAIPIETVQQRLRSALNWAAHSLPVRPLPSCQGVWLDTETINDSHHLPATRTVLCPKPHIGPDVFDLVNADTDCLKNPLLCHVIGQPIIAPFVVRATTQEQLTRQSTALRTRSDELLYQLEKLGTDGNVQEEQQAEHIREHIFAGVGRSVEQYVKLFGNTTAIEENFERWVFGPYWKQHPRSLSQEARNSLISGEFVWQHSQETFLLDWAAPAIQFCRAFEHELKRRLYYPCPDRYQLSGANLTLGSITYAYKNQASNPKARNNWHTFLWVVQQCGNHPQDFERMVLDMVSQNITEKRNLLAHGGAITKEIAESLREAIIGNRSQQGMLCWLAEHLDAVIM